MFTEALVPETATNDVSATTAIDPETTAQDASKTTTMDLETPALDLSTRIKTIDAEEIKRIKFSSGFGLVKNNRFIILLVAFVSFHLLLN